MSCGSRSANEQQSGENRTDSLTHTHTIPLCSQDSLQSLNPYVVLIFCQFPRTFHKKKQWYHQRINMNVLILNQEVFIVKKINKKIYIPNSKFSSDWSHVKNCISFFLQCYIWLSQYSYSHI